MHSTIQTNTSQKYSEYMFDNNKNYMYCIMTIEYICLRVLMMIEADFWHNS